MKKLFLFACACLLASLPACTPPRQKALLVFSYNAEYPWVQEEMDGVESVISSGVRFKTYYMDTKRRTSPEWMAKVAKRASRRIRRYHPEVVIVFDDNACRLVAEKYIGKEVPFVFCGMNADPADYGLPCANITGVVEREHTGKSIGLLRELAPGVKKVAFLTDASATSQKFVARLKEAKLPVAIGEIVSTDDFDTWKETVKRFQSEADALGLFLYHTVKEKGMKESLPGEEVLKWTLENNGLPEFATFGFTVREGALCGVTTSGYEQGKDAAESASMILAGWKPSEISLKCPEKGEPMVNAARAKQLFITIPESVATAAEVIQ